LKLFGQLFGFVVINFAIVPNNPLERTEKKLIRGYSNINRESANSAREPKITLGP
jgi:hypothetical protein